MANPFVTSAMKVAHLEERRDKLLSMGYWPVCRADPVRGTILGFWESPRERGPGITNISKEYWWVPIWVYLLVRSHLLLDDVFIFFSMHHPDDWFRQHTITKHYYIFREYPEKRLILLTEYRMKRLGIDPGLFCEAFDAALEQVENEVKRR